MTEHRHTKEELSIMQARPLQQKIKTTQTRLLEWFIKWDGKIYISFSGGKDSTVLADLAARIYSVNKSLFPQADNTLVLVFIDTGLEYPEIRKFVPEYANYLANKYEIQVELKILKPKMTFKTVIETYGYPVIGKEVAQTLYSARKGQKTALLKVNGLDKNGNPSKFRKRYLKYKYLMEAPFEISHHCCNVMKKHPAEQYEQETGRRPVIATMTEESQLRQERWLQNGCNAFDIARPKSTPMSFWLEQDVLQYIKMTGIPFASVYGEITDKDPQISLFEDEFPLKELITTGCERTGCMFCMFGIMSDKEPNRFQRMKQTHPKQYKYCIEGGHYENGLLRPDKNGLGLGKILDFIDKPYE